MRRVAFLLALLLACGHHDSHPRTGALPSNPSGFPPTGIATDGVTVTGNGTTAQPLAVVATAGTTIYFNVKNYGAKGDGITDDSTAIRNAITAASAIGGGYIYFPNGTYMVSQFLNRFGTPQFYAIGIPSNVHLIGQSRSAIIELLAGQTTVNNVRVLNVMASSVNTSVENLTIDGNYPNNTDAGLHNDAIFIDSSASRVRITGNEMRNCDGTGVNPNLSVTQVLVDNNYVHDLNWSGLSIGDASHQTNITIRNNYFTNVIEAIHVEITAGSDNIVVEDNYLGTVQVGNASIAIAGGPTPSTYVTNVIIRNNQMAGFVNVSNASNVLIEGNNIISSDIASVTQHCAVRVVNEGSNITVVHNEITITSTSNGPCGVQVAGNPTGDLLTNVNVDDNDIFVQGQTMDGVLVQTVIDARVKDNRIFYTGTSAPTAPAAGVHIYSKTNRVMKRVRVDGNRIDDFAVGVRVDATVDGSSYRISNLFLRHNTLESVNYTMATGFDLNPAASGSLPGGNNAVLALDKIDNLTVGVTTPIATDPSIPILIAGSRDGVGDYAGTGAPTFTATKGSTYHRKDGGAGTCLYVNESGSTTWVGK